MQRMKLNPLNDEERQILKLVVEEYYAVLPPALQVHSLFATHILSHTLHRFGIRTRVLPCRLWCSSMQPPLPHKRETVGGILNYWNSEKWNGHVVCLVGDWLVDVALYHLNPAFNYEVPKVIARRIALPEPGIYARYQLSKKTEFIWYRLPAKAAAVTVAGYEDFIDRFVNDLVSHIRRLLGYEDEVPVEEAGEPVAQIEDAALTGSVTEGDTQGELPEGLVAEDESGSDDELIAGVNALSDETDPRSEDAQPAEEAASVSEGEAASESSSDEFDAAVSSDDTKEPEATPA